MADQIRWGILSTANIGRRVIPSFHKARNGVVAAICSRDAAKARAFADEVKIPTAYGSYEELLADPNIDAIYNPLPNDLHAEWSMKAADAGKPVLCEKPLTANAAEARQLVDYFKAKGLLLAEAFMYRFHPQTLRVKKMVEDGAVGPVQVINSSFTFRLRHTDDIRLSKARAGGGLMDVGCYCLTIMRLVTGEEPEKLAAFARYNDDGVDVQTTVSLQFPSGVVGHFDCGVQTSSKQTYDIRGSDGRIFVADAFVIPNSSPTTLRYWKDSEHEAITIPPADEYQLMLEDFSDSLLRGRAPLYPAEDGIRNMEVLDQLRALAEANSVRT